MRERMSGYELMPLKPLRGSGSDECRLSRNGFDPLGFHSIPT
jgi:hypothetical protein